MNPRRSHVLALLCATFVLSAWLNAGHDSGGTSIDVDTAQVAVMAEDSVGVPVPEKASLLIAAAEPDLGQTPATPPVETASPGTVDPVQNNVEAAAPAVEVAETGSAPAASVEPDPTPAPTIPSVQIVFGNTPEPARDETAAPSVETTRMESARAALAEPDPATPCVEIVSLSKPDAVPNEVTANAAPAIEVNEMTRTAALDPDPTPPPATSPVQAASVGTPDPARNEAEEMARAIDAVDECFVPQLCIDRYLWSLYQRTPKIDTNKVVEHIKAMVKQKGKTRTVMKTVTKHVIGDFTWKDPNAAERAGMSLKDYVIGGMDREFKQKLYRALRAMDEAGLMPGITSAFRDDYRQSIATGNKAASDSSYHGGSRRGGYGHGLAADLVSVKGETRLQRFASSVELWKWIDAHERELGIGRPYLDRDPPHVGPINGTEYAAKRGRARVKLAALAMGKRLPVAPGAAKRAKAKPVKVGSL